MTLIPISTTAGQLSNSSSVVVSSQDMEPYLKVNDIVTYSNSTAFDNLKTADVIVFKAPEAKDGNGNPKIIVHRISEIGTTSGKQVVITKGDANPYSIPGIDFPIFIENYIGKVVSVKAQNETRTFAQDELIKTIYFSVEIPDTWAYQIVSNAAMANLLGFGPTNEIDAVPTEFASFLGNLNKNASGTSITTLTKQGGVFLSLAQNPNYPIKNAPLATYTQFVLDSFKIRDAFKFESITIDGENATKFYGNVNGNPENTYIFYITIHSKEPYFFAYFGNNNTVNYQKYLPDVERMIKSIKWID